MIRSVVALFLLATPAVAGDFVLSSPIDCDLEDSCYIQQYVDHDPSNGASDFHCAPLSYDGHKGTDFALRSGQQMRNGVRVIAAAPGIVRGTRDGMPDTGYTAETAEAISGKECGNGVVVRHDDGWETQYCHLRQGSVVVQKGDRIDVGDVIGLVGQSGRSQFPHLHLSVRKDGKVVDPFDPDGKIQCTAADPETLWQDPLPYQPGGLLALGFADSVPSFSAVKDGTASVSLTQKSPALVMFAYTFGVQKDDILSLQFEGPKDTVIEQNIVLTKKQAQSFRAIGKKRRRDWAKGIYQGTATLIRKGKVIDTMQGQIEIP